MIFNFNNTNFDYFGLFLGLALVFLFGCFVYQGYKKHNIQIYKLCIIYFNTVLFMLIGAKLFTIDTSQWKVFFESGVFPITNRLTVLGAITFGPLGFIVAKRLLGIKVPFLDMVAIPVLITMAIQRLGCLFAGCCHGVETNSFFGVCYGPNTWAHINNYSRGTIENFEDFTAPLHPVPFYFLLTCLLSAFLLFKQKHKFKASGNLFLMSISLFLFGRFFAEFLRDPLTNGEFGHKILGLKFLQLLLLIAVSVIWCVVAYREKNIKSNSQAFSYQNTSRGLPVLVLITLSLFTFVIFSWFTPLEKSSLFLFLSVSFFFSICFLLSGFLNLNKIQVAVSFASFFIVFVLPCTAQIVFDNSKDSCYSYKEVSFSGALHTFDHYHQQATPIPNSCNGYTYPNSYTHNVYTSGVSFAGYQNYGKYKRSFLKASAYIGADQDDDPDHTDSPSNQELINTYGGALILGGDLKIFGIEAGIIAGSFRSSDVSTGTQPYSLTSGRPELRVFPIGRIRVGFTKIIFFDARAGYPVLVFNGSKYPITIGLGTGLGMDNGSIFRVGVGIAGNKPIATGTLKIIATEAIAAECNVGLGETKHFVISVSYIFKAKQGNRLKNL